MQLDDHGSILAAGQGTIGGARPQTSTEGEQMALLQGASQAETGINIRSDCAAAISHNKKPYRVAAGHKTKYAAYRKRRAIATGNRGQRHGLTKVKAHRTKAEVAAMDSEALRHWRGNEKADELAKQAMGWHQMQTPQATCDAIAKATTWRTKVIIGIGKVLSEVPPARELYAEHLEEEESGLAGAEEWEEDPFGHLGCSLDGPEGHRELGLHELNETPLHATAQLEPETNHNWVWTGSVWHCTECFKQTSNRTANKRTCEGVTPSIRKLFSQASKNQHVLAATRDSSNAWCIVCERCGGWAQHKAIQLTQRCKQPTHTGRVVLQRLLKRRHPDGVRTLEQPLVRLTVAEAAAATAAQG